MNIGEEICGEWLGHVRGCEFVQYNLKPRGIQGEIDVLGLNLADRVVYVCEVAVHLVTGLQYVKANRPDNVARLTSKFRKDIEYVRRAFPDYQHVVQLWSPVVRNQREGSKANQTDDVRAVVDTIKRELNATVETFINETFQKALDELRAAAAKETKELDSSVMRFLQVEEHLARHLKRRPRGAT
jgi:hypothetical protein